MKFMKFNEDNRRIMTHNFPDRLTEQQKEGGYLFEDEQIPNKLPLKEGFYQELYIQLPEETLYWQYVEIPPKPKTEVDTLREELLSMQVGTEYSISAAMSSTNKVVDTLSSASVMNQYGDIELAYNKGMIDKEIVLYKVKTGAIDMKDYNTITGDDILLSDITLEQSKLARISACKRYYNKKIEEGVQSDISGQVLIYEYDERDQQNFADKMNFFNGIEITDKGVITQSSEFPLKNEVNIGDKFIINGAGVIDDDESKTNTGLGFVDSQEIYWNGITWVDESYFNSTNWIGVGLADENLKVPVVLTKNQFKNLYAQIGINKENYIGLCGIKINEINNSTSIEDIFNITF